MKVSKFTKIMKSGDFARTNIYKVEFGHIKTQGEFYHVSGRTLDTNELGFMAKSATLPGKQLGTVDVKRFGAAFKIVNDTIIDQVTITFMCNVDMRERLFMEGWLGSIYGMNKGSYKSFDKGGMTNEIHTYKHRYYDEYTSSVFITTLDRQGFESYKVELLEAYPTAVGPIQLAYGDSSDIASFDVTFNLRDWHATVETGQTDEGAEMDRMMDEIDDQFFEMEDDYDTRHWIEETVTQWEFDDIQETFDRVDWEIEWREEDKWIDDMETEWLWEEADDQFDRLNQEVEWGEENRWIDEVETNWAFQDIQDTFDQVDWEQEWAKEDNWINDTEMEWMMDDATGDFNNLNYEYSGAKQWTNGL